MIDGIPFGASSWSDVVTTLGTALPGSFTAIQNANFATSQLNSIHSCNIAPEFLQSYQDHFAALNPWEGYWSKVPAGKVALSEDVAPSSLFKNTEFYNDWLLPQNNVAAAAGLKIAADRGETIRMLFHYPLDKATSYDTTALGLMERLRGSLGRTMLLLRSVREATEMATGKAALVARGNRAAFIVGAGCILEDANDVAETLFRSDRVVKVTGAQIKLMNATAHAQFSEAVSCLCRGQTTDVSCLTFDTAERKWLVSLAAIGTGASYEFSGLLQLRRRVFVTVTPRSAQHEKIADYATTFRLFGLSPAEHALCEQLMRGETLSEISDASGVAKETMRSRLKSVFVKTDVARQADLILLLSKISG